MLSILLHLFYICVAKNILVRLFVECPLITLTYSIYLFILLLSNSMSRLDESFYPTYIGTYCI